MQAPNELKIECASIQFQGRKVLNNMFLQCRKGEIVGLLGRNGSGKSTLLKMIFGILYGQHRILSMDGKIFTAGYRTQQIGYLSQLPFAPTDWSVEVLLDDMRVPADAEIRKNALFTQFKHHKIGQLSGGHRRFFEIVSLLYGPKTFLLLDEPFSNISPFLCEEITQHILKKKNEKGIILTDHYFKQIVDISDRVILLHNGSNYTIQAPEDLATHGYISDAKLADWFSSP